MIRPRSLSDEDILACAIDCLAWRRERAGDEGEVRESLSAIRPKLAAMAAIPDGLLAEVDNVIGQELEDQWAMPAIDRNLWLSR